MKLFSRRRNLALPYAIFLGIMVVVPMLLIIIYAFMGKDGGFSLENFERFINQPEAANTFIYSIGIALITTIICIVLGYPAAYILSRLNASLAKVVVLLFIIPMWVNVLVRTLATVALFDFMALPLGEGALIFGMVYNFLPFMIYPIYNTLQKMDTSLIEAAHDLGAKRHQVFMKVTLPLSVPGIYSGIVMVFMPTVSTFAIAELLTHNKVTLFGSLIQRCFGEGGIAMWNYGAALSLIMLIIIGLTSFFGGDKEDINR